MMERGFAEKGITAEQLGAIRESNPNLFPPKEKEQPAPEKTSRREMSPEERAERKKKRDARRIMQAQGRLKPKQSSVKTSEVDPQVLSKALMGNTLE